MVEVVEIVSSLQQHHPKVMGIVATPCQELVSRIESLNAVDYGQMQSANCHK